MSKKDFHVSLINQYLLFIDVSKYLNKELQISLDMEDILRCLNFHPPGIKEVLDVDNVSHVQSEDIDEEIVDTNLMEIKPLFTNDAWVHILKKGRESNLLINLS